MTTYAFPNYAGGSLVFAPAEDLLQFPVGWPAASLRFAVSGTDLLVSSQGETLRLLGIGLGGSGLTAANLVFADGSLLMLDGGGSNSRSGGDGADWIAVDRGGADSVSAGGGDDRIEAGAALTDADMLDGGAGTADVLALSGTFSVTLAATTVTGVERIEVGSGDAALTLDAAAVATATPDAGAVFTVDGTAQGIGSRLAVDGSAAAGAMALLAGAGDDVLTGGFGADLLAGGSGDDTLAGGWGDDTIEGGAGTDLLDGDAGNDLFLFDAPGAQSPPATPDTILGFEGAGRAGGDRIALPPTLQIGRAIAFHVTAADFLFEGYEGSGVQLPASRIGDGFADVLWRLVEGEAWRFELWADLDDDGRFGAGDLFLRIAVPEGDAATSLSAEDFVAQFGGFVGGPGDDALAGSGGTDDAMWGEGGDDILSGGDGVDWLEGGLGDDTLRGGDLADELRGGPGSDWLEGGDGWDTLFAADPYTPETESAEDRNLLLGGAGPDALFGGVGLDTLRGEEDDDLLWGDAGDDWLEGGRGADLIHAREGNDRLDGGEGNDTLLGGLGGDLMSGGTGADLFVIDLSTRGLNETSGAEADGLVDFSAAEGDVISLGLVNGLVGGSFGPGPLAWRGALAARDAAQGVGFGLVLPGEGIGPGYYQSWWIPAVSGGQPAGGWFVIDLDQDLVLDIDDAVIRIGAAGPGGAEALTPEAFADGTFRILVGGAGADSLAAAASGQEVFGLGGADLLTGRDGADRLVGGEGNDTLLGAAGADQLWGGAGNDSLDGGAGGDELFAEGPGIGEVDGIFARNTLSGGEGADSLWGADGRDSLDGGLGNDRLYGGIGIDTLLGGEGADTLLGGDGADSISGAAGADSIDAGAGDDTVDYDPADPFADGGDDTDLLVLLAPATVTLDSAIDQVSGGGITTGFEGVDASAVAAAITLYGSAGRNRLIGGAFADRIEGRDGNDTLEGGGGADTLDGGTGDDLLTGGEGADRLVGGDGFDIASYASATLGVTVTLHNGFVAGGAAGDTLLGIEGLRGSAFADSMQGTGFADRLEGLAGNDVLDGYAGDDTILGGAGADALRGWLGNDSLVGGDDNDVLDGNGGDDLLDGGEGTDRMIGGAGNDLYLVDRPTDLAVESVGGGQDTVIASGNHTLGAEVEWLVQAAGAGAIWAVGNAQANRILGNEADNLLVAMAGDDTVRGGAGHDRLQGREGNDILYGEEGDDTLFGGTEADILDGGAGRDVLRGEAGDDSLLGGADSLTDTLFGDAGDDWLDGGGGYDLMYGGYGNDTYVVSDQVEGIVEFAGQGLDRVIAATAAIYTLPNHVEDLVLAGGPGGIGNALSNRITGTVLNETLAGRDGNDTLEGGGGADILFGEGGRDTFVFGAGSAIDAVRDFVPGMDRILLQGLRFTSFEEVMASTRQGGLGAIIDFAPGDAAILVGVQKSALTAGDFVFLA
ncbi:hypothetical protein GXW74_09210 [Roseomonas eburnea]|uniref:Calcium-binding protein n=1 Tax=Neoroseomonas eburnea TaxID=1346889 RepID=A0A9X9XAC9_9PROT|nr:hypothetical protein [Neoroseomonas eburnea]MBR0680665.1 hypothetical protein [Neoroseomonas eburnea]